MAWWESEDGRKRLAAEKALMLQTYSDAKLRLDCGRLYWIIRVPDIKVGRKDFGPHTIKVCYPLSDYPSSFPTAVVLEPHLGRSSPHQHGGSGELCLFNPSEGRKHGWDPARSTAVTIALWAVEWLKAYYTWKKTGKWPGDQEYVGRNDDD